MTQSLLSLLLIAYLPGALVYRLPMANRARRASLPAEERLFWAVVISVIASTTTAFVLAAISVYSLERLVASNIVLSVGLGLASLGDLRLGPSARGPRWTAAIPLALIAAGVWMYFAAPASENVLGGRDPGVYMSEGIQIAQQQSLLTTDATIAAVPPSTRDLFLPFDGEGSYYGLRFMGFHVRDPEAGTVSGQFPQGYPIWIAIAYGLDGVTGTRRVIAWWAILGVLAVYFAARRLIGPLPASAAAGLLTVHVIQTWYARYPNSEIVTQALLFSALLAHAYAHEDEDAFFGPVAASLLGLGLLTRFPVVLAVGAATAASMLSHVNGRRVRAGFLVTLAAWSGAATVYYLTQVRPYISLPITYLQLHQPILPLAAGGAAVCALLWAVRRPKVAAATRTWLPIVLIAAVTTSGIYGLFFREPVGLLAVHDAHSVRILANLYVTQVAFGLALVGYALVVWRSFWRAPALILAVTTLAFFFLYKMRIWPVHFWLARRFIPAILPGTLVFAAAAMFAPLWLLQRERFPARARIIRVVSIAAGALGASALALHYLTASQAIRTHVEYAGLIPRIERLAAGFKDNDLVIVEARAASDLHTLALPLSYIWARNVLVLYSPRPDKPSLVEFITWARTRYDNVYFLGGGGTDLLHPGLHVEPVRSERFAIPEYELTSYETYPRHVNQKPFALTVYRFVDGAAAEGAFRIDVGGADDLYLVRFHPKELWAGKEEPTFRWTRDRSFFVVPSLKPEDRELILRMSNGGRPPRAAPAHVRVFLGDRDIGTAEPTGPFQDYVFGIPHELATALAQRGTGAEIRIESATWTPRDVFGGDDDRLLGVMIDRAEIR